MVILNWFIKTWKKPYRKAFSISFFRFLSNSQTIYKSVRTYPKIFYKIWTTSKRRWFRGFNFHFLL